MSRCYPFPPPGYIRNPPAELELPAKKEKRKHKDKKKKRKKHSATNELILQEKDASLEGIQQSGLPNERLKAERESSLETKSALFGAANQDVIQRLQNDNLRNEGSSHCVLATNAERPKQRPQSHKLKNEGLSNGVLAANSDRLRADRPGENGDLAIDNKKSKQSLQVNSAAEVLPNGVLAMQNKRLKADNPRENLSSNGLAASSCKRPEQGLQPGNLLNEVFSNGVLSTKRKRLQADHHGDKSPPSGELATGGKSSQQGNSKDEVFLNDARASGNMRLQADRSGDKFLCKAGPSERVEQRLRADSSSIKAMRDGAQSTSIRAGNGNGKELLQHSQANCSRLQADKPKHEVIANGMVTTEGQKLQADNLRVKMPLNGVLGPRGGRSEQNLQAGTKVVSNGVRDSNIRSSPATNPTEKVFSGAVLATNCQRSEQISLSDRSIKGLAPNGVRIASTKIVQAGSFKGEVISPGGQATNLGVEQRLQAGNLRHEMQANGVLDAGRAQTDKSRSKSLSHVVAVTSHEKCDQRLQVSQLNKAVVSNGIVASNCEEFDAEVKVKSHLPLLTARATSSSDAAVAKDATPASRGNPECDDELFKICRLLARPLALPAADDEDWLISSNKQLQSQPREKWDNQIPQEANRFWGSLFECKPESDTSLDKQYHNIQKMGVLQEGLNNEHNSPADA